MSYTNPHPHTSETLRPGDMVLLGGRLYRVASTDGVTVRLEVL